MKTVVVYHRGYLARDRVGNNWRARELSKTAAYWMARAERGEVVLSQRRIGIECFEYIATVKGD